MRNILLAWILAAALAGGRACAAGGIPVTVPADGARATSSVPVKVGDTPVLAFRWEGKDVSLESLRGRIVLVHFWASWHKPSMTDAPQLAGLRKAYGGRGLVLLGVSLDATMLQMHTGARQAGFVWPQHCDERQWKNRIAVDWGVTNIPQVFLIGADGALAWSGAPSQAAAAVEAEFCNHPPKLVERRLIDAADVMLMKVSEALDAGKAADALALAAAIPSVAFIDEALAARSKPVLTRLEEAAKPILAEADLLRQQRKFDEAVTRYKTVEAVAGIECAQAARLRLRELTHIPAAAAAIERFERPRRADSLLAIARKSEEAGQHIEAYARLRELTRLYPDVPAAVAARSRIARYEADAEFMRAASAAADADAAARALALANTYRFGGRILAARQKYWEVIEKYPKSPAAAEARAALSELSRLP